MLIILFNWQYSLGLLLRITVDFRMPRIYLSSYFHFYSYYQFCYLNASLIQWCFCLAQAHYSHLVALLNIYCPASNRTTSLSHHSLHLRLQPPLRYRNLALDTGNPTHCRRHQYSSRNPPHYSCSKGSYVAQLLTAEDAKNQSQMPQDWSVLKPTCDYLLSQRPISVPTMDSQLLIYY